jgi:hypothetical protein
MAKNRLELTITDRGICIVEREEKIKETCKCSETRGSADQNIMAVITSPAKHWPPPKVYFL